MKKLYCYPAKHPGEVYVVPDGVTFIAGDAFSFALEIKEIYVPPSITIISDYFANEVKNLERLVIYKRKDGMYFCKNGCFINVTKPQEDIVIFLPYSLCYCKLSNNCPSKHHDYSISWQLFLNLINLMFIV